MLSSHLCHLQGCMIRVFESSHVLVSARGFLSVKAIHGTYNLKPLCFSRSAVLRVHALYRYDMKSFKIRE